jgi:YD repeat-containing protein
VTLGGQTTTFVYDADGALIKKVKPDGTSTLYLGGYEVKLSASSALAIGLWAVWRRVRHTEGS